MFVYRVFPAFISYNNRIPRSFGGITKGPFVKIRPAYSNDAGMLVHELTHVKQWYRTFGLHPILRLFKGYRLRAEVEAYRAQLKFIPDEIMKYGPISYSPWDHAILSFASSLSQLYKLDITYEKAQELLRGQMEYAVS